MFDYRFNKLFKKVSLGTGRVSFFDCANASKIARIIRLYSDKEGQVIVNTGDGYSFIRLANVLHIDANFIRREESGVLRDNGQAGYIVDLAKLNQALR